MRNSKINILSILILFLIITTSCNSDNKSNKTENLTSSYSQFYNIGESFLTEKIDSFMISPEIANTDSILIKCFYDNEKRLRKLSFSMLNDAYKRSGKSAYYFNESEVVYMEIRSDSIIKLFSTDSTTQFYRRIGGEFKLYQDTKEYENYLQKTHHFRNVIKEIEKFKKSTEKEPLTVDLVHLEFDKLFARSKEIIYLFAKEDSIKLLSVYKNSKGPRGVRLNRVKHLIKHYETKIIDFAYINPDSVYVKHVFESRPKDNSTVGMYVKEWYFKFKYPAFNANDNKDFYVIEIAFSKYWFKNEQETNEFDLYYIEFLDKDLMRWK